MTITEAVAQINSSRQILDKLSTAVLSAVNPTQATRYDSAAAITAAYAKFIKGTELYAGRAAQAPGAITTKDEDDVINAFLAFVAESAKAIVKDQTTTLGDGKWRFIQIGDAMSPKFIVNIMAIGRAAASALPLRPNLDAGIRAYKDFLTAYQIEAANLKSADSMRKALKESGKVVTHGDTPSDGSFLGTGAMIALVGVVAITVAVRRRR